MHHFSKTRSFFLSAFLEDLERSFFSFLCCYHLPLLVILTTVLCAFLSAFTKLQTFLSPQHHEEAFKSESKPYFSLQVLGRDVYLQDNTQSAVLRGLHFASRLAVVSGCAAKLVQVFRWLYKYGRSFPWCSLSLLSKNAARGKHIRHLLLLMLLYIFSSGVIEHFFLCYRVTTPTAPTRSFFNGNDIKYRLSCVPDLFTLNADIDLHHSSLC